MLECDKVEMDCTHALQVSIDTVVTENGKTSFMKGDKRPRYLVPIVVYLEQSMVITVN